jgi:hypothetical protein
VRSQSVGTNEYGVLRCDCTAVKAQAWLQGHTRASLPVHLRLAGCTNIITNALQLRQRLGLSSDLLHSWMVQQ